MSRLQGIGANISAATAAGVFLLAASMQTSWPQPTDELAKFVAAREGFINDYRHSGATDPRPILALEGDLAQLARQTTGELHARALLELAGYRRLAGRFTDAIVTYGEAAQAAAAVSRSDLVFDAEIGMARAYVIGARNHGAAAGAIERAAAAAGPEPTPKQLHDLASYDGAFLAARGELEAALVRTLRSRELALDDSDRFYAELAVGDVAQKFAERCDYVKLIDAKTSSDPAVAGGWGACRRAVARARESYERARAVADRLGWRALARQAEAFASRLTTRLFLIESRARSENPLVLSVFSPKRVGDVLVSEDFVAGASRLDPTGFLADMIDQVVGTADAGKAEDPRTLYLHGLQQDMRRNEAAALGLFQRAAALLATERAGFFDPRRRGTVIENRGEIIRDLGLRLLAFDRKAEAFDVFESVRARGLNEVAAALTAPGVTRDDREWLARLLKAEAQASTADTRAVESFIAGTNDVTPALAALVAAERTRSAALAEPAAASRRERLAHAAPSPARLSDLEAEAKRTKTSILLYWTTDVNVLVWHVGPQGTVVRTIFLPEPALQAKVLKLWNPLDAKSDAFDEATAKELFLFLIAPFEQLLAGERLLIVPQGALIGLPFEVLRDPASNRYLIERWITSYAPNATQAIAALRRDPPRITRVTPLVDNDLDTREVELIPAVTHSAIRLDPLNDKPFRRDGLARALAGAQSVHLLAHGELERYGDPLLSRVKHILATDGGNADAEALTAADLVGLPLGHLDLMVISSCESGAQRSRVSNEIYGLPWALAVGGVRNAVVPRWAVSADSNRDWMTHFYAALAGGVSPAEASATAMRAMRDLPPYRWAAMQVLGR